MSQVLDWVTAQGFQAEVFADGSLLLSRPDAQGSPGGESYSFPSLQALREAMEAKEGPGRG